MPPARRRRQTEARPVSVDLSLASDEELARRAHAGSADAFECLVRRYEDRVFRLAAGFTQNVADAQEIAQDTFVSAFQSIAQFRDGSSFSAWLITIARRKCIDHYRRRSPDSESLDPETPDPTDAASALERREVGEDLWRLAKRILSQNEFHVLWLKYVEGMDFAEIARVLRKSQTHAKVLAFRARRSLGKRLFPGWNVRSKPDPMAASSTKPAKFIARSFNQA